MEFDVRKCDKREISVKLPITGGFVIITALWDTAIRTMRRTPILAVPFLELFSYSLVDQYPGVQGYNPPFHNHPPKPSSSEAVKEAFWLRQLLMCGLKQDVSLPTPLFIDNRGAQLLAKNPVHHNNMKHIDVRHHFIRQCVADGSIMLQSIASADNVADICTKPLGKVKFTLHAWACTPFGQGLT